RGLRGSGKKNSNGSMPPRRRRSLLRTISVVVMETTAGMTRAATSANEGMVTAVVAPVVVWMVDVVCAFDLRMRPRSALMMIPNATDAMMMAIIDKTRFVD